MSHFVIDMPNPHVFLPVEDQFLQETLIPHFQAGQTSTVSMTRVTKDCFDIFLEAYPQPLATPAMLSRCKQVRILFCSVLGDPDVPISK